MGRACNPPTYEEIGLKEMCILAREDGKLSFFFFLYYYATVFFPAAHDSLSLSVTLSCPWLDSIPFRVAGRSI